MRGAEVRDRDAVQRLETAVDRAISSRAGAGRIIVSIRDYPSHIVDRIVDRYRDHGWTVEIFRDQRDGDAIELI